MKNNTLQYLISILLLLNGLLFISGIYVLGNTEAAVKMHWDLIPTASSFIANAKVMICFITGMLYLLAFIGFIKKKNSLIIHGFYGFIFFFLFYIVELVLWAKTYPSVFIGFVIFGGLSSMLGIYSLIYYKKHEAA